MHGKNDQHQHGANKSLKILFLAIILVLAYSAVEALFGLWAHSLALLGDAGHMASDAVALSIAAFATWIAQRPPSTTHTYGLGRAEVIAAWVSSVILLLISLAVIVEAVERIHNPPAVKGGTVMIVAFIGLIINLFVAWLLTHGERTLNIRAALLHVLSDVLGSFAALVSGAVVYFTHWDLIDPILSIVIGVLILISSLRLLRESLVILMEGVPQHIDLNQVSEEMTTISGVKTIHDLHIWTLSSGHIAISAHIDIHDLGVWHSILNELSILLKERFSITHITLQPEPEIYQCIPCKEPKY